MASMVDVDGGLGSSTQRALTWKSFCVPSGEDDTHSSSLLQHVSGVCPLLCDSLLRYLARQFGQLLVSLFFFHSLRSVSSY